MRRVLLPLILCLAAAACAAPPPPPQRVPVPARPIPDRLPTPEVAAENFVTVVESVEPVAERVCRAEAPRLNCDFQIFVDGRPRQPPNAFQTVGPEGRPVIAFTIALVAKARNRDELAFILGHEAAHHIRGHLPRAQASAVRGAILAGLLAEAGGATGTGVRRAQDLGAAVGARAFSKEFELEADALGTVIAFRSGFDPARGAAYFARIPDPGDMFLGTHPPNADRVAVVRQTLAGLR